MSTFLCLPTIRRHQCRTIAIGLKPISQCITGLATGIIRTGRLSARLITIIIAGVDRTIVPTSISTGPGRSTGALMLRAAPQANAGIVDTADIAGN